jgi:hypothetical protein
MNSTTVPTTVQIRRSRLLGFVAGVAAAAAGITWALTTYAVDTGTETASVASSPVSASKRSQEVIAGFTLREKQWVKAVTELTPEQLAAGAASAGFGTGNVGAVLTQGEPLDSPIPATGYMDAIRPLDRVPTRAEVLGSLSPAERRYVKAVMALTPEQLAAGAASAGFGTGNVGAVLTQGEPLDSPIPATGYLDTVKR